MSKYKSLIQEIESFKKSHQLNQPIKLIVASKYFNVEQIERIYDEGQCDFGENRLNEALLKMDSLKHCQICWHFFGHLQSNKLKKIIEHFQVLHSVDSLRIAEKINHICQVKNMKKDVFLQIKIVKDDSKYGMSVSDLKRDFGQLISLSSLKIKGLMGITPYYEDPEESEQVFRKYKELIDELNVLYSLSLGDLSLGMSRDWPYALRNGSTHLRIGRVLVSEDANG